MSSFFRASPQTLILPDGRTLSFGVYGAGRDSIPSANHATVFYLHGLPSSHDEAFAMHDAALARGFQIVALDRPGYAASTPQKNRKILDWPQDVLAVADYFAIDRFAIVGSSGGSPYALACLHSLPKERLIGVGIACGVYPVSFGLAGMKFLNRLLFNITPWVPSLVAWIVDYTQSSVARDEAHPEIFENNMRQMFKSVAAPDRVIFENNTHGYTDCIISAAREALKPGGETFALEFALLANDWGFNMEDLGMKAEGRLALWHGSEDVNVPFRMAEGASKALGVELRRLEGEGHVGPVLRGEEILDFISGCFEPSRSS